MGRRPGYVRQRGDSWEIMVELDPDPLTGKRRRKYATAPSARAAERLRAKLIAQAADGTAQGPERRTVAQLADAWLTHIERSRSPYTMIGYRSKIARYIVPNVGGVRLDKLSTIQLDGLYAKLRASGGEVGQELSAQTVRHVHAILHAMLNQARKWGWIVRNPADDASPPASPPTPVKAPTPDQVLALYEETKDRNLALAIWLCAVVGPRRGEVCALRWCDVTGRSLVIGSSLVVAGGGDIRVKSTKTDKVRRVSLDGHTLRLLAKHRREARANADACGVELTERAYILSESPSGADPIHPDVLSKRFMRLADRLGIDCHMHQLRHFAISAALEAGIPVREVADRVGHASPKMTLDRYGHVLQESPRAAEAVAGMLRGR